MSLVEAGTVSGRFAVLAYRRASPISDLRRKGEKAWASFLKTVKPAGGKK